MEHTVYVILYGAGSAFDSPRQHIFLSQGNYNDKLTEVIESFNDKHVSYVNGYRLVTNMESGMAIQTLLHHRFRVPKPIRELNPPMTDNIPF